MHKVLVFGSGPIIIGQAAEFDYAGTQACRSLRELGIEVVLHNSNPATIMTDPTIADRVYVEPLVASFAEEIISKERPDALLGCFGGQTGLNLTVQLAHAGVLERNDVRILGTPLSGIEQAEDRGLFRDLMQRIGEPVAESVTARSVEEGMAAAEQIGYPVILRPAFTLGGYGGGAAYTPTELRQRLQEGLAASPIHQVLVEKSLLGFKEIEYEVLRDAAGHVVTVCNMENVDPVGIHTGDSIVVAPSQTLTDEEYQMLRRASIRIVSALGVVGACNVQLALDPRSEQYYVIEVNPRVSRSSALASKATGYPIAQVAAKLALGLTLDEVKNAVTGSTYSAFEPALDYVVVKIPRWPFDKFAHGLRRLGTSMKSTGEVMAIERSFEGALNKALRSLDIGEDGLLRPQDRLLDDQTLQNRLIAADDERIFLIGEAFRRGAKVEEIQEWTRLDPFFLCKIHEMVTCYKELEAWSRLEEGQQAELLKRAKAINLADSAIARATGLTPTEVRTLRAQEGLRPVYHMVDTCAGEFEAISPYFYSTYAAEENEVERQEKPSVIVLGAGPIRIGQGIEFDYSCVHAVLALRQAGYTAIMINNNPETVSTDFNLSDRLYFEPLTAEDVLAVIEQERPVGVVVQFGGQTALKLAGAIAEAGVPILGTSFADIDAAEDRQLCDRVLAENDVPRPTGGAVTSLEQAQGVAERVGFPAVVRPSYVLGGRAMEIVHDLDELHAYLTDAVAASPEHPVLVDHYIAGREVEVDAVSDGRGAFIPGVMEHIERAGVHSGDSIAVYPALTLSSAVLEQVAEYTQRIAQAFHVCGLLNIQFAVDRDDRVYVLEVNPRGSRTVPFLSKVTGLPIADLAIACILGKRLSDLGLSYGIWPEQLRPFPDQVALKLPVFSFAKLPEVEIALGPEMKSTGEVMAQDRDLAKALYKGFLAAGISIPHSGAVLMTVADADKQEAIALARRLEALGFRLLATPGTAAVLTANGIAAERVNKIHETAPTLLDRLRAGEIGMVINTVTPSLAPQRDGFQIRRAAVERGIPCLTSLDTAEAIVRVLESFTFSVHPLTPPVLPEEKVPAAWGEQVSDGEVDGKPA